MSLEKTTQELTSQSMCVHEYITVRSIDRAIDRVDRKTRIVTYTFCKHKTLTESENKEQLSKTP